MRMPGEVPHHALPKDKKDDGQEDCKQEMSDSERWRLRFLIAHDSVTGRFYRCTQWIFFYFFPAFTFSHRFRLNTGFSWTAFCHQRGKISTAVLSLSATKRGGSLDHGRGGNRMRFRKKRSPLEKIPVLILLGLLAGAVGGLGVGLMQLHSMSTASSASSTK
jgi:hypothetical protein